MAKQKNSRKKRTPAYKTLTIDQVNYKTTLNEKFLNRKEWVENDIRKIDAFIPGRVLSILVQEGQPVHEGDTLLILEAMKMNNRIMAPMSGTIKKIHVNTEDRVPKGRLLIEME